MTIFFKKITFKQLFSFSVLFLSFTLTAKPIAENTNTLSPILPGQFVPEVNTVTIDGERKPLKAVLNNKPTILFFYRGGWCPFCNTQMGQLQSIKSQLSALGFQLIGISTDSPNDLKKSIEKQKLDYQLLSDFDSTVSKAFGVAFFTSDQTTKRYMKALKLANALQKNLAGEERLVLPAPAVYVIDQKGLVQFQYVNPNFKVRLDPDILLLAAKKAVQ